MGTLFPGGGFFAQYALGGTAEVVAPDAPHRIALDAHYTTTRTLDAHYTTTRTLDGHFTLTRTLDGHAED